MITIPSLLTQLTLEEKAALVTGASVWSTVPVERLGVPEMILSDGPHGVRRVPDVHAIAADSLPATAFPTASSLACTWDVDLIRQMGAALGEEAAALGVGVLLGPGANMKRSPLGGRNFEYFSEDPFLAGEMAAALIEGVQGKGVGTSLKHFAANNQETRRFVISAEVDERTLREIYLPAFEKAVKQAKPWTVMCAYNKLNGSYCSEHRRLLTEILKDEWGFEGAVVSDWGAVHDRVASLEAGLDLEMPGPQERRTRAVVEAVRSGALQESILDEAVRRLLGVVLKAAAAPKGGTFDAASHHALARRIAAEGMVLLKNDGLLPLKDVQHLAVIGRAAEEPSFQGGGSSHIHPTQVAVPFKEIQALAGDAELTYAEGYPSTGSGFEQGLIDEAVGLAKAAEAAVLFVALPASKESEGYDRPDLDLTPQQVALIKAVSAAQPRTVVVLNNGAPVAAAEWIEGPAAVLEAWMMGQAGGGAVADVLFGVVNPGGRLAETFPVRLADTPAALNWPGENGVVRYGEGLFIGYRYYDAKDVAVQFPFGFGLSYTMFTYSKAKASAKTFRDVDGLTVSVEVTNTGKMAGKETVQVYVRDLKSSLVRPPKELKGFAKVALEPGEKKTVSVRLDFRAFAFYHPGYKQWITEDGEFEILIGASAADIRARLTVTLESTLDLPCILDRESTIREWLEDRRGRAVFEPMFRQMTAAMGGMLGGGAGAGQTGGMDMLGFMMEMPLLGMLQFQAAALPQTPEEIVDGMLAQARTSRT
jgi:beta-glucosidase